MKLLVKSLYNEICYCYKAGYDIKLNLLKFTIAMKPDLILLYAPMKDKPGNLCLSVYFGAVPWQISCAQTAVGDFRYKTGQGRDVCK
jgi:hypothetical protein